MFKSLHIFSLASVQIFYFKNIVYVLYTGVQFFNKIENIFDLEIKAIDDITSWECVDRCHRLMTSWIPTDNHW